MPKVLDRLQDEDQLVMAVNTSAGTEYRLQTAESTAWHEKYREQEAHYRADTQRLAYERAELFKERCQAALGKVSLVQGRSKEARKLHLSFDATLPKDHATQLYAWVQDGWATTEKNVLADARNLGLTEPTLLVFIPAQRQTQLDDALVGMKAADMTLQLRGNPTGPEGMDARSAMETRLADARRRIEDVINDIFVAVRVFQAGGRRWRVQPSPTSSSGAVRTAWCVSILSSIPPITPTGTRSTTAPVRRTSRPWPAVGHTEDADKHPVAKALLGFLGPGRKGGEIRDHFLAPPFGWPQDAVDGALYTLLAGGYVLAQEAAHQPVTVDSLERKAVTRTFFKPEKVTITPVQLIQIRKLFQRVGIQCAPGEEQQKAPELLARLREAAAAAGGDPPRPAVPDGTALHELAALHGNELLLDLYSRRDELARGFDAWVNDASLMGDRLPGWHQLEELLGHAAALGPGQALREEAAAIRTGRMLLATPDPVPPLRDKAVSLLHRAFEHKVVEYNEARDKGLAELEADANWLKLEANQRDALLAEHGLHRAAAAPAATADALLEALERTPLDSWADRIGALPARFDRVRMAAAKQVEPKVTSVQLPKRVLHDEAELEAWLEEARRLVAARLAEGPVML